MYFPLTLLVKFIMEHVFINSIIMQTKNARIIVHHLYLSKHIYRNYSQ